ncbi:MULTISPECIES: hypothetical protein [unclassified Agrococcus]|uniref:hypothetical protein n=1 Tax=unclassified Agrococcus TaxID=2615065 RepID=UPI003606EF37
MTQSPPPHPQQPAPPGWPRQSQQPAPTGWGQQPSAGTPGVRRRANALGIGAIAMAALVTLLGPAQQLAVLAAVSGDGGGSSIAGISGLFVVLHVVLALVTIGLGIGGLVVRDRGRLLAAAAVGVGASVLVGVVLSAVIGLGASTL